MTLSTTQRGIFEKARRLGTGAAQIQLDDSDCLELANLIARDLGVTDERIVAPDGLPEFYDPTFVHWHTDAPSANETFEALVENVVDGELFFHCLAAIHLRRIKYARILSTQPLPTLEQVGHGILAWEMAMVRDAPWRPMTNPEQVRYAFLICARDLARAVGKRLP